MFEASLAGRVVGVLTRFHRSKQPRWGESVEGVEVNWLLHNASLGCSTASRSCRNAS
jgi:hypothetical protein